MIWPAYDDRERVAEIKAGPGPLTHRYKPWWRKGPLAFPISLTMPLDRAEHPGPSVLRRS